MQRPEDTPLGAALQALGGVRPRRYEGDRLEDFRRRARELVEPGMEILDAGGGRSPVLAPVDRPANTRYVGLDILESELAAAPPGSYDDAVVGSLASPRGFGFEQYDAVLSWQVLEHVKPLDAALANVKKALRPGGTLLAEFSGSFSLFGLLGRVLPVEGARFLMGRLHNRPRASVFPLYGDKCWPTALRRITSDWSEVKITAFFLGADYFAFWRVAEATYLAYEEWATRHPNLATHIRLEARR